MPTLLTPSDFTYLGYYNVALDGLDSPYARCLTHRYVSGELRFFNLQISGSLFEFSITGQAYGATITAHTNAWTNIGGLRNINGIWWEEATQRLWSASSNSYTVDFDPIQLFTRTLPIGGGAVGGLHGPVGLAGLYQKRVFGGVQRVPAWFVSAYSTGAYVCGWGGYTSLMRAGGSCSLGPSMFAIPDIAGYGNNTEIAGGAYKTLMDGSGGTLNDDWYPAGSATTYDRGTRADLPENYFDGGDYRNNPTTRPVLPPLSTAEWLSPAPDGLGRFVWGDSYHNTGQWIDGTNKHGFVAVAGLGAGKTWYANSTLNADSRIFELHIFDPLELGQVALGTRQAWNVKPHQPTALTLAGATYGPIGGLGEENPHLAATYDAVGKRFYVMAFGLDPALGLQYTNRLYVYAVSDAGAGGSTTMTAGTGVYALTGTAATLTAGGAVTLTAASGTVTITGTATTLTVAGGYALTADSGSVTITGTAATLTASGYVTLTAAAGAVTITGTAATLTIGGTFVLSAGQGAIAILGTDAVLTKSTDLPTTPRFQAYLTSVLQGGTTGAPVTQQIRTVPFRPQVALFFGNGSLEEGFSDRGYSMYHSIADATIQRGAAVFVEDAATDPVFVGPQLYMNVSPSDGQMKSLIMAKGYELEGLAAQARVSAWYDTGIDIDWFANDPAYFGPGHIIKNETVANTHVCVLFLGGTEFLSAVVPWQNGGTYPGSQSIAGFNFTLQGVIQLVTNTTSLATFISGGGGEIGLGWFSRNGHQGAQYCSNAGGTVSVARRLQRSTYARLMGGATVNAANALLSINPAGFTLENSFASAGPDSATVALGVGGACLTDCGAVVLDVIGLKTITVTVKSPEVLMAASVGLPQSVVPVTGASAQTGASRGFGVATATAQRSIWTGASNGVATTVGARYYSTTEILTIATPAANGAESVVVARVQFVSFGVNTFTIAVLEVDGSNPEMLWYVLGEERPGIPVIPPPDPPRVPVPVKKRAIYVPPERRRILVPVGPKNRLPPDRRAITVKARR